MRTLISITVLVWVLALTNRCSTATENCTSVDQDRIHQSLSVSYNTARDTSSATATLRFGDGTGTTLKMNGNCRVTHSIYTLDESAFLGTSYTGSRSGFDATHTFTFTNNDGRSFVNSATMTAVSLSSPPTSVGKASGATVNFTPAVASGETVYIYVLDSQSRSAIESSSTVGATSVTITAADLAQSTVGSGEIYAVRSKSVNASQAAGAGGAFSTSYESAHASLTITN